MGKLIYGCGCEFPIIGTDEEIHADWYEGQLPTGIDVDIYRIPHTCSRTWNLLGTGATKGVFQLEGHLGRTWAAKIQPENMEELGALVALLRPGCLKAMSGDPPKSMTHHYKDRKQLLEDVEYLHPTLKPILGSTYGVLTYQEQSMKIAVTLAGFNLQQADVLRKAIGKKKPEIMAKVKGEFMSGCTAAAIVEQEVAEEIFGWIQESQRYSFNKSHAISYGEGGYWTAFLKAHFPVQFYCSYLEGAQWKQDTAEEVSEIVNDAKITGITISVPDFRDQREIPYIKDNDIFFGLGDIKQIGASALAKVRKNTAAAIETLGGKDVYSWTWLDYLFVFASTVPSTVNEALISCGALDFLKKSRTSMLYELGLLAKLTKKELEWVQTRNQTAPFPNFLAALTECGKPKKEGGGCFNVKRVAIVKSLISLLQNPPHAMYDTADYVAWSEDRYLGTALSCSKVDGCDKAVEANTTCLDIHKGNAGHGYTVIAVEVIRVKEIKTKRGKNPGRKMAFLSVKDGSCMLDDLVAFPEPWKEYGNLLYDGNTVLIQGEKGSKRGDSFAVKKVWQI